MIHHISIAAQNPLKVAQALSEIWQGQVFAFYPNPGSYIVTDCEVAQYGSAIEVHPCHLQLMPGIDDEPCQMAQQCLPASFEAVHAAISVPTTEAQIRQIAEREGWRVVTCDREAFTIIEVWVENRFLLEFLPPDMVTQYLASCLVLEQVFGAPIPRDRAIPSDTAILVGAK